MAKKKIDYTDWTKEDLVKEITRIKETTYGLVWHRDVPQEKIDVIINSDARTPEEVFSNEVSGKPFPVLKSVKTKDIYVGPAELNHILIEGDNYHALAVLNFTHSEQIDLIYIDPPYNTGNSDFIYNDKYVDKEDSFRHSKWLSYIEKRLKLAKNLLKRSGVIVISIDDHEQAPLKMLCDEIFGGKNFVACLPTVMNLKGNPDTIGFTETHEYTLVYAKDKSLATFNQFDVDEETLESEWDEDEFGLYKKADTLRRTGQDASRKRRPRGWFPVFIDIERQRCYVTENDIPANKKHFVLYPINKEGDELSWTWGKKKITDESHNLIITGKGQKLNIYKKQRPRLGDLPTQKPKSILYKPEYSTSTATNHLKSILGSKKFDGPKPVPLIMDLLFVAGSKNALILDFMAGSGTTAEAVLRLNKIDDGSRRYILATNNENNIIEDVTHPRLKNVIKGYKDSRRSEVEGLGGNLKYFTAYDFVESEPTDKNKRKLVKKSTEMLCIKEGVYDLVAETDEYKILKNPQDKYMGVIFYEDAIPAFKNELSKIKHKVNTYVFSLGDDPHRAEFKDVKNKVVLQPIPDVILRVYREIFK